jgi:hypothetical protein
MRQKLEREKQVHLVISEGTKVLTRPGRHVGVVAHAPSAAEHSYRVRFADRAEESFHRTDLTIFKHVRDAVLGGPDASDLYRFVIYRCVVRSTAYRLSHEGSAMDGAVSTCRLPTSDSRWPVSPRNWKRTTKNFAGKSKRSFGSR